MCIIQMLYTRNFSTRPQVSSIVIMIIVDATFSKDWSSAALERDANAASGISSSGSCVSWRNALELHVSGKRKEYSARGTYRSEYK